MIYRHNLWELVVSALTRTQPNTIKRHAGEQLSRNGFHPLTNLCYPVRSSTHEAIRAGALLWRGPTLPASLRASIAFILLGGDWTKIDTPHARTCEHLQKLRKSPGQLAIDSTCGYLWYSPRAIDHTRPPATGRAGADKQRDNSARPDKTGHHKKGRSGGEEPNTTEHHKRRGGCARGSKGKQPRGKFGT